MTILELARQGKLTDTMKLLAEYEGVGHQVVLQEIAQGRAVVPLNKNRDISKPVVIGKRFSVKVNANVGTSPDSCSVELEKKKIISAIDAGADCVMDLSIAGNLPLIRNDLLSVSPVPFGTVPIYEVALELFKQGRDIADMEIEDVLSVLERQAREGVDFFTIHAGLLKRAVDLFVPGRIMGIVSRGGALIAEWMMKRGEENPLYAHFDKILALMREYDITISLGDGLRPGGIRDATDKAQIDELIVLGELVAKSRKAGVQAMVEGPGHVPLDQIEANMLLEDRLCNGAPFYVLGPLPTDIALGYDDLAGAVGGALAGWKGAAMLCYLTASEHVRHPDINDVKKGVIGVRIAAHIADLAKGIKKAWDWDNAMSEARFNQDWDMQIARGIDPQKAKELRESSLPEGDNDICTMCGQFCAVKRTKEAKKAK